MPLVFVGGDAVKVARVCELLPDAVYSDWAGIHEALAHAMEHPPSEPVVPASNLAGYSGTPLPRKLGIKSGYAVALVGAPEGFERTLGELPPDATLRRRAQGRCDLIIWFVGARRELERRTARYGARAGAGGLWISAGPRTPPAWCPTCRSAWCAKPGWRMAWWTTRSRPSTRPGRACALRAANPADAGAGVAATRAAARDARRSPLR